VEYSSIKVTKYINPKNDTRLDPQILEWVVEKTKLHLDLDCLGKDLTCFF